MAKKTSLPTAVESFQIEAGRERLPSAFLKEIVPETTKKFPAKVCFESLSEAPVQATHPHLDVSFGSALDVNRAEEEWRRNQWRLAQFQRQHSGVMDAEVSILKGAARESSRERVLRALKGVGAVLGGLKERLVATTMMSQSVHTLPYGNEFSGVGSPNLRNSVPILDVSGLSPVTQPLCTLQRCESQEFVPVSNPSVILEVPTVSIARGGESPSRHSRASAQSFQPLASHLSFTDLAQQTHKPHVLPFTICPLPDVKARAPESVRKMDARGSPKATALKSSFHHGTPLDAREQATCDRLTSFLNREVVQRRNPDLIRMLQELRRFG